MKTPDEIKNALECCSEISVCSECPYYNKLNFGGECVEIKSIDALNYIRQLENHIGELTEKVTQLEDAQPKWISVEERLPENDSNYLCYLMDGCYEVCTYYGDGEWVTQDDMDDYTRLVTHWMELPEPPKEE